MSSLELTGERTLPGIARENYWFQRHVAAYRHAATLVRGAVIDAGSGEGYGTELLAGRGPSAGVDLDPAAVAHAARRYPHVPFVRADLERLPVRPRSVDGIVALQVIEHLTEPAGFLGAARRALRPGGTLVLSTPNRATFPAGMNPWHTREYDAAELRTIAEARFDDVELLGLHHGPMLALLDRVLGQQVQHRLVGTGWEEMPGPARTVLRRVGPRAFRIGRDAAGALDLIAVARVGPD